MAQASSSEADAKVFSFPPLVGTLARVLILGSMPGVASLQAQQYYAHRHNRFWPILGAILGFDAQASYAERCAATCRAGVAVWDVLQSCVRPGSLDSNIDPASVIPNDLTRLLVGHPELRCICFNGAPAQTIFNRHISQRISLDPAIELIRLPSTSPANASVRPEAKLAAWKDALGRHLQAACAPAETDMTQK